MSDMYASFNSEIALSITVNANLQIQTDRFTANIKFLSFTEITFSDKKIKIYKL